MLSSKRGWMQEVTNSLHVGRTATPSKSDWSGRKTGGRP